MCDVQERRIPFMHRLSLLFNCEFMLYDKIWGTASLKARKQVLNERTHLRQ